MQYDPKAVHGVLHEYDIEATLVLSDEPDLDPHSIELSDGLAIVFDDALTLVQDVHGNLRTRGKYHNLTELIDWIREYQEMNR